MGESGNLSDLSSLHKPQIRDRVVRLFTYLRELVELRTATIRSIGQYEKVLWFNDIPNQPGCHCIAWESPENQEQSEVWVEIQKPKLKAPPKLPEALQPWLDPQDVRDSSLEPL